MIEITGVPKGQHHPLGSSSSGGRAPEGGLDSAKQLKTVLQSTIDTELGVFTTDLLSLLMLLFLPDNSLFFCSLKTFIAETCSGQALWPGLNHKIA